MFHQRIEPKTSSTATASTTPNTTSSIITSIASSQPSGQTVSPANAMTPYIYKAATEKGDLIFWLTAESEGQADLIFQSLHQFFAQGRHLSAELEVNFDEFLKKVTYYDDSDVKSFFWLENSWLKDYLNLMLAFKKTSIESFVKFRMGKEHPAYTFLIGNPDCILHDEVQPYKDSTRFKKEDFYRCEYSQSSIMAFKNKMPVFDIDNNDAISLLQNLITATDVTTIAEIIRKLAKYGNKKILEELPPIGKIVLSLDSHSVSLKQTNDSEHVIQGVDFPDAKSLVRIINDKHDPRHAIAQYFIDLGHKINSKIRQDYESESLNQGPR